MQVRTCSAPLPARNDDVPLLRLINLIADAPANGVAAGDPMNTWTISLPKIGPIAAAKAGRTYDIELDNITSVLIDICDALAEEASVHFLVGGFGQDPWPVDVRMDLPVVIEQVPMRTATTTPDAKVSPATAHIAAGEAQRVGGEAREERARSRSRGRARGGTPPPRRRATWGGPRRRWPRAASGRPSRCPRRAAPRPWRSPRTRATRRPPRCPRPAPTCPRR
jgi:hypothetical protein